MSSLHDIHDMTNVARQDVDDTFLARHAPFARCASQMANLQLR